MNEIINTWRTNRIETFLAVAHLGLLPSGDTNEALRLAGKALKIARKMGHDVLEDKAQNLIASLTAKRHL